MTATHARGDLDWTALVANQHYPQNPRRALDLRERGASTMQHFYGRNRARSAATHPAA